MTRTKRIKQENKDYAEARREIVQAMNDHDNQGRPAGGKYPYWWAVIALIGLAALTILGVK